MYGPLVIDPLEPEPFTYQRDYVVMLSDWTDEDPVALMKTLKKQSDYYNLHKPTVGDFVRDVGKQGWSATVADRWMWAQMKMNPTDIADVSGATYTFLMNGHAPDNNWTGVFRPGEKLHEELLISNSAKPTAHPMIHQAQDPVLPLATLLDIVNNLFEPLPEEQLKQLFAQAMEYKPCT